jgi:voltage-gated potassium channel
MTLARIYGILHDGSHPGSRAVTITLSTLIVANALAAIVETMPSLPPGLRAGLTVFEVCSIAVFGVEYVLRVHCSTAGPTPRHPVWGRIRYLFTPLAIIDLAVILPFFIGSGIDVRTLRVIRLLRLLRLLRYEPYARSLRGFTTVIHERRGELMLCAMVAFGILLVTATAMYYVEREAQPERMGSIPDCLWWAVIHLTTIGYGDVYPVTQAGKILAGITALIGVSMVTLPSGLIAMAYAEQIRAERVKNTPGTQNP